MKHQLNRKVRIMDFSRNLIARFRDDEVPALGAQLTYYLILAFFPFLIFLVTLIGFVQLSSDTVLNGLIRNLPASSGDTVRDIIREVSVNRNGAFLSVGMIATIWAASSGVNAVIKGLNKAYDEEETRPFWKVRGISLLATVVLALVIMLVMLMLIFGRSIGEYMFQLLSYPDGFEPIWAVLKYVVPLAAMIGVFMLLYWITPNRKMNFKEVIPGAVFASIGWIVTSFLFSIYVNQFGNYTKTYGSLGGVIVLLIWLYLSSIIIILGGEINATIAFGQRGLSKKPVKRYGLHLPFFNKKHDPAGPNKGIRT
ncbi:YihY/virulence factor BrkB family protein [Paenibacillus beijingensis]|uniref:Ribonuclease n=1 Tax=Paenibacillus beijingensis TaxID=1126833 RepID=A0A0D5NM01_9BACL|nr:YihY/virulence factor BrkB family protein [Paenibacillus beijingensis]AJY76032.1 ribonuclease [Paenibacillus beijingensis]